MMSISDLSHDLVEEILSRVPMTCLGAMRSTCKLWNTLSKDPSIAAKETMVIIMQDSKACLMSVNLHNNHKDLEDPFIKQIGKLNHTIYLVFHCKGLFLCRTEEYDNSTKLMVWNPYSGQTKLIQPSKNYDDTSSLSFDIYGMGYDSNNNQKILKFRTCCLTHEIYDLKSNSWRVLDTTSEWNIYSYGLSLKGNIYYIAYEEAKASKGYFLLCFDFTRERFWRLPQPCYSRMDGYVILSVVREEKLAVLSNRSDALEMEIWITNKIEPDEVSWSHFLKVDMVPSERLQVLVGSFFVDEKKKVAVICDIKYNKACMVGEGRHYREVDLGESICELLMSSPYVPSSVQIQ